MQKNKRSQTIGYTIVVSVLLIMFGMCLNCADVDMYHTIATGREILQNGIPHENIWAIDDGLPFMAQMWLYSVVLAWLDRFPYIVFPLFSFVQVCILLGITYYFCRMKKCGKMLSFGIAAAGCFLTGVYAFSIRPETFTMCLVMFQCLCIEKYLSDGKWRWLLAFMPIMLLEANAHSSMWFLHMLVSAAYICYIFRFKQVENTVSKQQALSVVIASALMLPTACVSPYEYRTLLYTFQALSSKTFEVIPFIEMQHSPVFSVTTVFIALFVCIVAFVSIKGWAVRSVSLNFAAGFSVMAALAYRNVFFCMIPFVYLTLDIYTHIDIKQLIKKTKSDYTRFIAFVICGLCAVSTLSKTLQFVRYDLTRDVAFSKLSDVILQTGDKTDSVLAPMTVMSYFEYLGYTNVYMDTRPELYNEEICGKPVLQDYAQFVIYGEDGIDAWLDSYAFDYIITSPQLSYLHTYMPSTANYVKSDTVLINDVQFNVYQRTEGE